MLHLFHFPFLEYSGSESRADEVINIVLGIHPPTKHQQLRLSSKPHVPSSPRIILVLASRDVTMARYAALQQLACRHMPRPGALQPHYHHSKHIPTSHSNHTVLVLLGLIMELCLCLNLTAENYQSMKIFAVCCF